MNTTLMTVQDIKKILHSVGDPRYLHEKSSDTLQDVANAVNNKQLLLIKENIPELNKQTIEEILETWKDSFQHSKFCCAEIRHILETKYQSKLKEGFEIIPTPLYNAGKADIGLIHNLVSSYETIVAVEVGDVRFDKPIDAFYLQTFNKQSSLSELWVYPTPGTDYSSSRSNKKKDKYYYIFRKGPKFNELKRELDMHYDRVQKLATKADPLMHYMSSNAKIKEMR